MTDDPRTRDLDARIGKLEARMVVLADTFAMALAWMAQSANSPLNVNDVKALLQRIDGAMKP